MDHPSRFTSAQLLVSADCEDAELFARLVQIAENGCIMVNTLKGKFDLAVRIVSPSAQPATPPR